MVTEFNLWDIEVGKQLGHFTDERQALILVKKLVGHYGDEYANELGLGRKAKSGRILEPLSGAELLARMREVLPDRDPAGDRRSVIIGSTVVRLPRRREPMAAASRVLKRIAASGIRRT